MVFNNKEDRSWISWIKSNIGRFGFDFYFFVDHSGTGGIGFSDSNLKTLDNDFYL
jgi:hypothetical protein